MWATSSKPSFGTAPAARLRRKRVKFFALMAVAIWLLPTSTGAETFQDPADFVADVFNGESPEARVLWLDKDIRAPIEDILGHSLNLLRVRYWHHREKTAWILNEIGKEEPITAGFAVANGAIEKARVLIYRENRGYEVRYSWFTDQFLGMQLEEDLAPNQSVDGISGATLSVRAVTNMARLALYLHDQVMDQDDD